MTTNSHINEMLKLGGDTGCLTEYVLFENEGWPKPTIAYIIKDVNQTETAFAQTLTIIK